MLKSMLWGIMVENGEHGFCFLLEDWRKRAKLRGNGWTKRSVEMDVIKIPIGRSGFADIRKNENYYVDKIRLNREVLRMDGRQVTLITRLNRYFGFTRREEDRILQDTGLTSCLMRVRDAQLKDSLPEGCLARVKERGETKR